MGEKKADDLAERGGKHGKTAPQSETRRTVEKVGQGEGEAWVRGTAPVRDTRRTQEETGQGECEAGVGGTAPVSDTRRTREKAGQGEGEAGIRGTAPKSNTRRTREETGQVERELGYRGTAPVGQLEREVEYRGTAPVADAEEVLGALTRILRGEEEAKTSEILRAAELLGKQYGLFGDREGAPAEAPKIVIDVPGREGKG